MDLDIVDVAVVLNDPVPMVLDLELIDFKPIRQWAMGAFGHQ